VLDLSEPQRDALAVLCLPSEVLCVEGAEGGVMAVPVFHATVSEAGKLTMLPAVRGFMQHHLETLKGKAVVLTIAAEKKSRTDRQSRYYFGVVVPLIAEHCGYDKQEMHECLAMRFLRIEDDTITGSPRRKRTPATDTKEFAEYVDACIRLASELGVYIPDHGATE
jgi:hypothetical protein